MKFIVTEHKFDLIVIGSGGAGLMSAISAFDHKVNNVAVISKTEVTRSHTVAAKGGINASLSNITPDDWKWHAFDTIKGSDYLADVDSVEVMCKNASAAIIKLEKMGVVFTRNSAGKIDQQAYGAQTTEFGAGEIAHRACYSKDQTGHTILHTLYQQALARNIKFFTEHAVIDLLIENGRCFGAIAIDLLSGKILVIKAKVTIIATGGYSQIYRNTTSSTSSCGDGSALIARAGLALQDMEFAQFHPTGLYGCGFLLTEAARAEGAKLINALGERFMERYAPNMMELASRDVIARAILSEINEGRGCENKFVYLDLTEISAEILANKLSSLVTLVKKFTGLDPAKSKIPILPSAHYTMGGIPVTSDLAVVDTDGVIQGLSAVGEAACVSVHGANRLGCNSLLELIVFGEMAGTNAAKEIISYPQINSSQQQNIAQKISYFETLFAKQENALNLNTAKIELQQTNDYNLGVFRNQEILTKQLDYLKQQLRLFKEYKINNFDLVLNDELISYLELQSLLYNSIACAYSALCRTESRGAHYRSDYQEREDQSWRIHSLVKIDTESLELEFSKREVRVTSEILSTMPDLDLSPKKRVY